MNSRSMEQDEAFQSRILQGVSRTFALTIPTLPPGLCRAVSNAYLLCRIADTIEDDADLPFEDKRQFSAQFIDIVRGTLPAKPFADELAPRLAPHASDAERELVANTGSVIRITHSMNDQQRKAIERCVRIMADGMVYYQAKETLDGLADQPAMDRYCYYVAGVVGEMLTELFCDYCPELKEQKSHMMRLGVSFGQGLQMTNILKDIWDDRARGACWLPRDGFERHGVRLSQITPGQGGPGYTGALGQLVAIAHGHLRNALRYTLIIPGREVGIRKFCLWALGMAVLTLRKINKHRDFKSGPEVKISRRDVKMTVLATSAAVRFNFLLVGLFNAASAGLPTYDIATPVGPFKDEAPGRE